MRINSSRTMRAAVCALAVVTAAERLSGQATGQVTGKVQAADTGKAVARAFVTLTRVGAGAAARRTVSGRTGVDGAFTLGGLAAGSYRVCVQAVGSDLLLDPCRWEPGVTVATVAAGQTTAMPAVVGLKRGATLRVRVVDPQGLLAAAAAKEKNQGRGGKGGGGVAVLAGVWSANGLFAPLRLTSRRGGNWDHDLVTPAGASLRVTVTSPGFELADEKGARVDPEKGAAMMVQTGTAAGPTTVVYRVTGEKGKR